MYIDRNVYEFIYKYKSPAVSSNSYHCFCRWSVIAEVRISARLLGAASEQSSLEKTGLLGMLAVAVGASRLVVGCFRAVIFGDSGPAGAGGGGIGGGGARLVGAASSSAQSSSETVGLLGFTLGSPDNCTLHFDRSGFFQLRCQ
ncbi:hypothetical protein DPMN_177532 [Dreissena polymorpha]|uniref:Uncharacterized protein n=1 Tax=Dreissena polymorpha TaxID=45954 RepID=A0A9D4ILQ3_DREPO|nr:hypothetical protein DPMN_177532 [Dreissena polymorpha]